jgi:hypothetical protein
MQKNKLDHIWNKIADDLNLSYLEDNRESLARAIQELPKYKAPEAVWLKIETELSIKLKVKKHARFYLAAASIALLIGLTVFVFYNTNTMNQIHYVNTTNKTINLYEIADTSSSVFSKIMNSSCSIKPSYCASNEFKSYEKQYQALETMQQKILKQAVYYDNENELETMLLKIENQKKNIEQLLIAQINS